MKHLFAIVMLTTLSLHAMKDSSTFVQEEVDYETYQGIHGTEYAELGKRILLFRFDFIGARLTCDGHKICVVANKETNNHIIVDWSNDDKLRSYSINKGLCGFRCSFSPEGADESYANNSSKIAHLYGFICDLAQNKKRKKEFLDFYHTYLNKGITESGHPLDFITQFERNLVQRHFLWTVQNHPYNVLNFDPKSYTDNQ